MNAPLVVIYLEGGLVRDVATSAPEGASIVVVDEDDESLDPFVVSRFAAEPLETWKESRTGAGPWRYAAPIVVGCGIPPGPEGYEE